MPILRTALVLILQAAERTLSQIRAQLERRIRNVINAYLHCVDWSHHFSATSRAALGEYGITKQLHYPTQDLVRKKGWECALFLSYRQFLFLVLSFWSTPDREC